MDDRDRIDARRDVDDSDEDVETWPAGLLANYTTGADTTTGNAGAFAPGPVGAAQARKLAEAEQPEEARPVHVPIAPGVYGPGAGQTADEGVSPQQSEAEADELNG
jgi:hypothetical protein